MKAGTIVKWSFLISLIVSLAGAYLKITHTAGAQPFLIAGIVTSLVFTVSAIYEVRASTRINFAEKTMWTVAFLFMSGVAGLVYFLVGRKRIIGNR